VRVRQGSSAKIWSSVRAWHMAALPHAAVDLARSRYQARAATRHGGHVDTASTPDDRWGRPVLPLGVGPLVDVGTSRRVVAAALAFVMTARRQLHAATHEGQAGAAPRDETSPARWNMPRSSAIAAPLDVRWLAPLQAHPDQDRRSDERGHQGQACKPLGEQHRGSQDRERVHAQYAQPCQRSEDPNPSRIASPGTSTGASSPCVASCPQPRHPLVPGYRRGPSAT